MKMNDFSQLLTYFDSILALVATVLTFLMYSFMKKQSNTTDLRKIQQEGNSTLKRDGESSKSIVNAELKHKLKMISMISYIIVIGLITFFILMLRRDLPNSDTSFLSMFMFLVYYILAFISILWGCIWVKYNIGKFEVKVKSQRDYAFLSGRLAFEDDLSLEDCPYKENHPLSSYWYAGWEDANNEERESLETNY